MANLEKYKPNGKTPIHPQMTQAEIDALPAVLESYQVAQILGTGRRAVQNAARWGRLPYFKIANQYRFSKKEICDLLGVPYRDVATTEDPVVA